MISSFHFSDCYELSVRSMPTPSSPLTLSGKLKLNTIATILLAIVFFAICITSCEARHELSVSGKYLSKKSSRLQSKDLSGQVRSKVDQSVGKKVMLNARMELAAPSSGSSSPHGSLNKRSEDTEVMRLGARERLVLGIETNTEQVGSKATTTAHTAETLAAMDYPVAHPAPAIHNR